MTLPRARVFFRHRPRRPRRRAKRRFRADRCRIMQYIALSKIVRSPMLGCSCWTSLVANLVMQCACLLFSVVRPLHARASRSRPRRCISATSSPWIALVARARHLVAPLVCIIIAAAVQVLIHFILPPGRVRCRRFRAPFPIQCLRAAATVISLRPRPIPAVAFAHRVCSSVMLSAAVLQLLLPPIHQSGHGSRRRLHVRMMIGRPPCACAILFRHPRPPTVVASAHSVRSSVVHHRGMRACPYSGGNVPLSVRHVGWLRA